MHFGFWKLSIHVLRIWSVKIKIELHSYLSEKKSGCVAELHFGLWKLSIYLLRIWSVKNKDWVTLSIFLEKVTVLTLEYKKISSDEDML